MTEIRSIGTDSMKLPIRLTTAKYPLPGALQTIIG